MKNPAREKFFPLLSPYVDGELTPDERQQVEQHLANNRESASQVADFRAGDALIRHALEMQGDDVDWKAFTDGVMSQLTPDKLPLMTRLKLTLSELFTYQRGPFIAGLVGAAAAIAIAVPMAFQLGAAQLPTGYGAERLEVQRVSVDSDSAVRPVVMETDEGDAVIWVVETNVADGPDGGKRKGDTSSEEELQPTPDPQRQGDL